MSLYDHEFVEDLSRMNGGEGAGMVGRLCLSAAPDLQCLRAQMERWFECLPLSAKDSLVPKLRGFDDTEYMSAYAELYFGAWLRSHVEDVNYETLDLAGRKPDWTFADRNGKRVVFEVASFRDLADRLAGKEPASRLQAVVREAVAGFSGTCIIHLLEPMPKQWSDTAAVRSRIASALEGGKRIVDLRPSVPASLRLTPRQGGHGEVHVTGPSVESTRCIKRIKQIIEDKLGKYGNAKGLDIPFIVGLLTYGSAANEWVVERAMYGDLKMRVQLSGPPQPQDWYNSRSGIATKWTPTEAPINTTLSAFVWCEKKRGWDGQFVFPTRVYHNPFAANPLPLDVFEDWPQFAEMRRTETEITIGRCLDRIFSGDAARIGDSPAH